eukprot:6191657-Pleurochrysis_carterae.AAC.4
MAGGYIVEGSEGIGCLASPRSELLPIDKLANNMRLTGGSRYVQPKAGQDAKPRCLVTKTWIKDIVEWLRSDKRRGKQTRAVRRTR